jgi:hypothetical protein
MKRTNHKEAPFERKKYRKLVSDIIVKHFRWTQEQLIECTDEILKLIEAEHIAKEHFRYHGIMGVFEIDALREKYESQIDGALERTSILESKYLENHWMPINTAPKDGVTVLVVNDNEKSFTPESAYFGTYHPNAEGKKTWRSANMRTKISPTHWKPLPDRPKKQTTKSP